MGSPVKEQILKLFTDNKDEFISGEYISKQLGISRTAIWKYMNELKAEGIEIEAVRKVGYKIVGKLDKITQTDIKLGLETKQFGRNVIFYEEVESTQNIANELVLKGAEEGTIVLAERQVKGRGRLQRNWVTGEGKAIAMSIILKPKIPPKVAPQLTLLAAVAVASAISKVTNLKPSIKWPNDILINNKKVCGILTEMHGDSDLISSVIVGIGINVNQEKDEFPNDIISRATSIRIEEGKKILRSKIVQAILMEMEKLYAIFLEKGFVPIKLLWESYAISLGREITATTYSETIVGKALGITDEGQLLLEDEEGKIHTIYSADISII
jgi:BirA family biotin operon repressor/biotin-[acetyl-CoA-carboxylase] ligase